MNRRLKISFLMGTALLATLLMTHFTHYMFTLLPTSLNTSMDLNARDVVGGLTPLMRDAESGNLEHAQELIAQGANLNALSANQDRDTALNIALINALSNDRILMIAKLIIEAGADIHLANARGEQAVHTLLRMTDFDKRMEILDMLVARGADINAQTLLGETILHISVSLNYPVWIDMLNTKYGQIINYNVKNNQGQSPLQFAEYLLRIGAGTVGESLARRPVYIGSDYNIREVDGLGRNGLMLALIRGDQEFALRLLQDLQLKKVNLPDVLTAKDTKGNTALHYAVLSSRPDFFVPLLLQNGAQVNAVNNYGDTPLLLVPQIWRTQYRVPVAQILLKAGANPAVKNRNNKSVAQLAAQAHDTPLQNVVESALLSGLK